MIQEFNQNDKNPIELSNDSKRCLLVYELHELVWYIDRKP